MKVFIGLVAFCLLAVLAEARRPSKTRYDNFKLYGVTLQDASDLKTLRDAGINVSFLLQFLLS